MIKHIYGEIPTFMGTPILLITLNGAPGCFLGCSTAARFLIGLFGAMATVIPGSTWFASVNWIYTSVLMYNKWIFWKTCTWWALGFLRNVERHYNFTLAAAPVLFVESWKVVSCSSESCSNLLEDTRNLFCPLEFRSLSQTLDPW